MADTTVTGRIGDQDVQLINAASEATLQKLLEAFNKANGTGSTGGGTNSSAGGQSQQAQATAVKTTTTAFNKLGTAVGQVTSALGDMAKGILGAAGQLTGALFNSVGNFAKELFFGGERLSDFVGILKDLPLGLGKVGGWLFELTKFLEKNVDVWRELSQVGAAFNNNIFDMRRAAASAGMNLDEFASFVKTNSTGLAMFGTSVTAGVQNFSRLSKEMRNGKVGTELMNMGFTMTDLNESLMSYATINAKLGRQRENSDRDLVERAGEFAKELDLAAKVTGLNRKELEKSLSTIQTDARIRTMIGGIADKSERAKATANLALIEQMKTLSPAFKDLATGAPQLQESFALQQLSGGRLGKLLQQGMKGQIDSVELNNRLVKLYPEMEAKARAMGPRYINALQKAYPAMASMLNGIGEMSTLTEKSREQALAEQKKTDEITEFLANFEKTIRNFRTSLEDTFFKSDLFKRLKGYFDGFLSGKSDQVPRILKELTEAFDATLKWMDKFLSDVESNGLAATINDRAQKFITWMFNLTEDEIAGAKGETRWAKIFNAVQKAIKDWWETNSAQGTIFGDIKKDITEAVSTGILGGATAVWTAIKNFAFEHWDSILIGFGAIAALWLTKNFIGGIATGAGQRAGGGGAGTTAAGASQGGFLAGLGAQFTQAAGWLMKGVAIGASMVAIGYGLGKLAEGIAPMQDISWETLGKAGTTLAVLTGGIMLLGQALEGPQLLAFGIGTAAIAALGFALRAFPADVLNSLSSMMATVFKGIGDNVERVFTGISNIIGKITEMRTSVIDATTKQIKELAGIPATNMLAAAAGIDAIKKALDGFTPGFLGGLSEGLGGLLGRDKIGPLQQMAILGPQLQASSTGFVAFKAALDGMKLSNLSMTGDQIDSFERLTAKLPKFTESITAIGAQSANINAATTAIQSFKQAANGFDINQFVFNKEQLNSLADGTTKLKALAEQLKASKDGFQKLDTQGLKNIKEGVEGLSKAFKDFNDSFINKFLPKFEETRNKTQEGIMSELGNKLDTLNTSVKSLITIEDASKKNLDTIANKKSGAIVK